MIIDYDFIASYIEFLWWFVILMFGIVIIYKFLGFIFKV
jgi:hypothetical protein